MRLLILAASLFCVAIPASAQVRITLDVNDIVKSTFLTETNSDTIIDGLNANATQGKQFAARLIPGGSIGILTGTQVNGVHSAWGSTESWNGAQAEFTLQGYSGRHGLIVHTTGTAGMGIIGWSSTGAQALKAVQDTYFDSPALTVFRPGATAANNAPAFNVVSSTGVADLTRYEGSGGSSSVDHNAAIHPPHIPDVSAMSDSVYFSTTQSKLCYKDSSGAVHPLY